MEKIKGSHIWIIGASSGIGAALARELSDRGAILSLSARRQEALILLASSLGAQHHVATFDVTDLAALQTATAELHEKHGRIDAVINLSAVYQPMSVDDMDVAKTQQILDVNLRGTFNVVHAVLPVLRAQQSGDLVLCGSVAGFIGLPQGQPYSATKAAVINLAETLRAELSGSGVIVKLINPGFVRTPLTDQNSFDMPAMIEPAEAARQIAKGLTGTGFEIHFPKRFTLVMKFLRLLPYGALFAVLKKLVKKQKEPT